MLKLQLTSWLCCLSFPSILLGVKFLFNFDDVVCRLEAAEDLTLVSASKMFAYSGNIAGTFVELEGLVRLGHGGTVHRGQIQQGSGKAHFQIQDRFLHFLVLYVPCIFHCSKIAIF